MIRTIDIKAKQKEIEDQKEVVDKVFSEVCEFSRDLDKIRAGEIVDEIAINHNGDVDIKGMKNGKWLGLEYEIKGSHTTEELIAKKAAALGKGMVVRFICSSADYPFISKAVGEDYTLKRGSAVADFLRDL